MTRPNKALFATSIVGLAVVSLVLFSSWKFRQQPPIPETDQQVSRDTIPDKKIRDLDDVLRELDEADLKVNMEEIRKEIAEAMNKIDVENIRLNVEKAMREIDMEKIREELETSLAGIDMEKIKEELKSQMKDMEVELKKVKEIDLSKMETEMKAMQEKLSRMGPEIEESINKAKVEIEKAKADMKEYKNFVDGLEKDGLIVKKEGYTIKHKDGELLINGKKADPGVYDKYRGFLEKHRKFEIRKTDDDFDLDID